MQVLIPAINIRYDPIDKDATHFGHKTQRNRVGTELEILSLLAGTCGASQKVLCRLLEEKMYQWSLSAVAHVCCTILT